MICFHSVKQKWQYVTNMSMSLKHFHGGGGEIPGKWLVQYIEISGIDQLNTIKCCNYFHVNEVHRGSLNKTITLDSRSSSSLWYEYDWYWEVNMIGIGKQYHSQGQTHWFSLLSDLFWLFGTFWQHSQSQTHWSGLLLICCGFLGHFRYQSQSQTHWSGLLLICCDFLDF